MSTPTSATGIFTNTSARRTRVLGGSAQRPTERTRAIRGAQRPTLRTRGFRGTQCFTQRTRGFRGTQRFTRRTRPFPGVENFTRRVRAFLRGSANGRTLRARTLPGAQGFTLLELLVVVTIIGLLAGAVVLSVGLARNEAREIEHEVLRLSSLLDLVREEAIMQSREFAVLFAESGYRFYVFDHLQQTWVAPPGDALLRSRTLPEPLRVDLRIEGRNLILEPTLALAAEDENENEDSAPQPQLMLLSSGEMTAFEATFYRDLSRGRIVLTGELDGTLELHREGFDGQ